MNKKEYIQANRDWLETKAKEDGVKDVAKETCDVVKAKGNGTKEFVKARNKSIS